MGRPPRIELQECLGQGSFAQTFKARVVDHHLARKWSKVVAVKVPLGEDCQETVISDIVTMAYIQGALSALREPSPSLVRFYGCEKCGPHYVMVCEYVPGRDLQTWIEESSTPPALPYAEVVSMATQVLEALAILHGAGVYHRDLKPSNILLTGAVGALSAKVADFGLSTVLDAGKEAVSNSTHGAISYAPPEYLRKPTSTPITPAYDTYSLGMTLYQVCCNKLPFVQLDMAGVASETQALDEPYRHPHALNLTVPDGLCDVIMKAIAKRPERRYQSAAEMLADVESVRTSMERVVRAPANPQVAERLQRIMAQLDTESPNAPPHDTVTVVLEGLTQMARSYPDQPNVFVCLGRLYARWLRDPLSARQAYEDGLQDSPDSSLLLYHLGCGLLAQRLVSCTDRERAVRCLKRALQIGLPNPSQTAKAARLVKAGGGDT